MNLLRIPSISCSENSMVSMATEVPIPREIRAAMIAALLEDSGVKPNKLALNPLSSQQTLCLCLLAAGQTTKECALLLNIKEETVHKYERRIREKLKAVHRVHAYHIARQKGYIIEYQAKLFL